MAHPDVIASTGTIPKWIILLYVQVRLLAVVSGKVLPQTHIVSLRRTNTMYEEQPHTRIFAKENDARRNLHTQVGSGICLLNHASLKNRHVEEIRFITIRCPMLACKQAFIQCDLNNLR